MYFMKHYRENVVNLCGVTDVHTVVVASGAVQGTGSRVSSAVVGQEINNNPLASGSSEKRLEARPSQTVEFNRTWLLHHFSSLQTHSLTVHVIRRSILVFLVCAR